MKKKKNFGVHYINYHFVKFCGDKKKKLIELLLIV